MVASPSSPAAKATSPLVLLVEDEPPMRRFLESTLADHGFRVIVAEDGQRALSLAATHNPDLVVLDLGLPDLGGIEVTTRLREWSQAPILVVSARDQQADKVAALDAGANDFVTKPFAVGELMARLRVWVRQASRVDAAGAPVRCIGDLRFDFARRLVFLGDDELRLTRTEYRLLALFVANAGKVLSHRQILESIWGPRHTEDAQYVRVYMGHLRRKIEKDPARPRYLVTEAGIGYRLRTE
jgi:two-component system KDP operon response regulator KdpE